MSDQHGDWPRRNTVRDDLQRAWPHFLVCRNIEMSGYHLVRCYGHTAVIVRAAVEDMPGSNVRDADQWIVGRGLNVVSISCALRHPIEEMTGDCVRAAGIESIRSVNDLR
jgi:hypothetical protein